MAGSAPGLPQGESGRVDLAAGLALGALVGALVGLSSVPVVASVVTGLVALLVAFFGLQGSADPLAGHAPASRVAGFGVGMLAFLVLGILSRTHGWLQPTVAQRAAAYRAADYPPDLARDAALYEHLGLLTGKLAGHPAPERPAPGAGMLFSDDADADCGALAGQRFESPVDRFEAMRQTGGRWAEIGTAAARLGGADGAGLAEAAWALACKPDA